MSPKTEHLISEKKRKKKSKNESFDKNSKKIKIDKSVIKNENNIIEKTIKIEDEIKDDELEITDISKEEINKLNGKFLRKAFNSSDGFQILKKFVKVCKQNEGKDLAAEYLESGGSVLEILRLLESSDKKNYGNAMVVFAAMQIIIIKILAEYPEYQSSTEEACRYLMNTHLSVVHSMLSGQTNIKQKKICLQLLAAIASIGGTIPCELMNHLSLHSQLLEALVHHSNALDPQSIRVCFIHFILAFLVDGDTITIKALLDKQGVLSSIFPGLVYDYANVVYLVLSTIKKYVLQNSTISKTKKLHIFSTPVLRSIVNLYNWKGPNNFNNFKKQKTNTEQVDENEKKVAIEAVHDFLVILLTSSRYGIVFHDRSLGTHSGAKHNQIINTVLQSLEKPWEHEKPLNLVVKILTACPDLIKSQLVSIEPFLVPRDSENWISVVNFISKVIESIDVESCIKFSKNELDIQQFTSAFLNIALPITVMKHSIIPALETETILLQEKAVELVIEMLKKLQQFITEIEKSNFTNLEINIAKNTIRDYCIKQLPNFELVLKVWSNFFSEKEKSFEEIDNNLSIVIKDRLFKILNLLEFYNKIWPELILATSTSVLKSKSKILLTDLFILKNINEDDLRLMKVKALKIILAAESNLFIPNEEIFSTSLLFLLSSLNFNNSSLNSIDKEIYDTIILLFNSSNMFEGCHEEIEIWIENFRHFEKVKDKIKIANFIIKILKKVFINFENYLILINELKTDSEEKFQVQNDHTDLFNELYERNIDDLKLIVPMQPKVSVSLVLYAAVKKLKNINEPIISDYMSLILVNSLHCQVEPITLTLLVKKLNLPVSLPVCNYLSNMELKNLPGNMEISINIFNSINRILSGDKKYSISSEGNILNFQINSKKKQFLLSSFELKSLYRMTLFYLINSIQKNKDDSKKLIIFKQILISFMTIAGELKKNNEDDLTTHFLKITLKNPVILQFFKAILHKEDLISSEITFLVLKICNLFLQVNENTTISQYLVPFQDIYISQIKKATKMYSDQSKLDNLNFYDEFIGLFNLESSVINDLLNIISNLRTDIFVKKDESDFSVWGIAIIKLFEYYTNKVSSDLNIIDPNLSSKYLKLLINLKNKNVNITLFEDCLYRFYEKFTKNAEGVKIETLFNLLKTKISDNIIKIISLLVQVDNKKITAFLNYLNSNESLFDEKSLIFSILSNNLEYPWNASFLNSLYNKYSENILNFLSDSKQKETWISENLPAISYLIENIFDPEICNKTCNKILSNSENLENIEEEHVKLYHHLFKKSYQIEPNALKNLIRILIHSTVIVLKKESKNFSKIDFYFKTIIDTINLAKSKTKNFIFEELINNNSWSQFARLSLKVGLKLSNKEPKLFFAIKALSSVCDVAYKNNSYENYVKTIFEMTTSHSDFINIMLSDVNIKEDLLHLLWVLVKKNHTIMSVSHIPLYLASYNATLSVQDQHILKIIQLYEINKINLDEYRPYLWGTAAASHYSIRGNSDTALLRQPSTSQVLDLFDLSMVINTIENFPSYRTFQNTALSNDKIYDPAFYLPIISYLLSSNNVVACSKVIHSGALALTLISCSSSCNQIRLAAFTILSKFYFHLEATSSKEKLVYLHFLDALRNGIIELETPLEDLRLNGFVAVFLARSSLITTNPMDPLYSSLHNFLMAKSSLDLNTIPEFLEMFNNSDVQFVTHRHWVLKVIRDGLKTKNDMEIALKYLIFKILFTFYNSSLADKETKKLILQILLSVTNIPKSDLLLINEYSLLPWLINASKNLDKKDTELIDCIVNIINNILLNFCTYNIQDKYYYSLILKILENLKIHFNLNNSTKTYKNFIFALNIVQS